MSKESTRKCFFGGLCKWKMVSATDPFTFEEFHQLVCSKCGKPSDKE